MDGCELPHGCWRTEPESSVRTSALDYWAIARTKTYLLDLYECFAHMHLSAPCAYPVPKEAKGLVLAPLELQLEMVGTHVVAQN